MLASTVQRPGFFGSRHFLGELMKREFKASVSRAGVGGWPDQEAEQVAGAERRQELRTARRIEADRDRGRGLEPAGQGLGARAVGRVAVLQVHARLVADRPGRPRQAGEDRAQALLQAAVQGGVQVAGVMVDHVDVAQRRALGVAVQPVPDRAAQEAGADPGIGQAEPGDGFERPHHPGVARHQRQDVPVGLQASHGAL